MTLAEPKTTIKQRNRPSLIKQRPAFPSISIIMSVHNGTSTINRALRSIQAQTFTDWEIIIVDDASTDNTQQILFSWQSNLSPDQMTIINNSSKIGLTKSLNKCLPIARGKYIARLDADDMWHPDKLKQQSSFLDQHPDIGVVGSFYANIHNKRIKLISLPQHDDKIRQQIYSFNPLGHSCVLLRKHLILAVDGYNTAIYYGQDRELWFRLLPLTSFYNLPAYLCYRQADQGISATSSASQMMQSVKTKLTYLRRYRAPIKNYLYLITPILIVLTPNFIKQWRNRLSYAPFYRLSNNFHLSLDNINLLFVNDRPLVPTRAETVARRSMFKALSNHPIIRSSRLANTSPWRALLCRTPSNINAIYLRCGAITAAAFALRNIFTNRKLILEVHNHQFGHNKIADFLYYSAAKRINLLITIADSTKTNWIRRGISSYKILILPSGYDQSVFRSSLSNSKRSIRRQLNLPPNKQIVLYSGNLYRHRGIEDILQSAQALSHNTSILFILLGGTQPDRLYYQDYLKHHFPRLHNVQFLPHQPIGQVPAYLIASDILLVTYSKHCPTLATMSPLKLTEALASGTPAIVADVPQIRCLASADHVTYYQPDNAADLSQQILSTLKDPSLTKQKALLAQSTYHSFSWSNRADRIINQLTP